MKLQVQCVYASVTSTHAHTLAYVCIHVCVKCARACSLPAVWQESSVSIILVTVVSGKNSVTVSVQSVLGDVSIRLRWLIPVQLHCRCVYYQMSGAWPYTWEAKKKEKGEVSVLHITVQCSTVYYSNNWHLSLISSPFSVYFKQTKSKVHHLMCTNRTFPEKDLADTKVYNRKSKSLFFSLTKDRLNHYFVNW